MRRLLFIQKNIDRNCTNHSMHDIMNKFVYELECLSLRKKSNVVFDYSKDTIRQIIYNNFKISLEDSDSDNIGQSHTVQRSAS